jgi:hypothetical protein
MTTPLESRYRLLLGAYPPEHRRAYQSEMIGVLMDGARPGQRFPAIADAADLVLAGFRARIGRGRRALRSAVWRDAAAVVGLLGAVVLTAVAGRRLIVGLLSHVVYDDPMIAFGVEGALVFDVALRTTVWLAVVIAAVCGARRLAAFCAVVAALVETAVTSWWSVAQVDRLMGMSWLPVLTLLVVGSLFVASGGRPVSAVMGVRPMVLGVVGAALAVVAQFMIAPGVPPWVQTVLYGGRMGAGAPSFMQVVLAVPLFWALWRLPAPVRRRVVALAVPVLIMPLLTAAIWANYGVGVTPGQVLLAVAVPVLVLSSAVQALRWHERRLTAVATGGVDRTEAADRKRTDG